MIYSEMNILNYLISSMTKNYKDIEKKNSDGIFEYI
jgi:hypothetical protein